MDLTQLNEWLTKTTLGTIVLGAVGSALFAFVYWITKNFVKPWLLSSIKYLIKKLFIDHLDRLHTDLSEVLENKDIKKSISFFAFHLMVIILSSALIIVFLTTSDLNRSRSVFQSIILFAFLTMPTYYILLSFVRISVVYKINFPDKK